jgi:hypothetical protein
LAGITYKIYTNSYKTYQAAGITYKTYTNSYKTYQADSYLSAYGHQMVYASCGHIYHQPCQVDLSRYSRAWTKIRAHNIDNPGTKSKIKNKISKRFEIINEITLQKKYLSCMLANFANSLRLNHHINHFTNLLVFHFTRYK